MYEVKLSKSAIKYYKKCNTKTKRLLNECFKILRSSPLYHVNIKRLHGELEGLYRYRVGDLRVIYKVNEEKVIVIVVAIGSRGDIYKKGT
jgi:mRNA interferase RelE/StbE